MEGRELSKAPNTQPSSRPEISEMSTVDIVKATLKNGQVVWKAFVMLPDGRQFLSDQCWGSPDAVEAALREHLKELGCPEQSITVHKVN